MFECLNFDSHCGGHDITYYSFKRKVRTTMNGYQKKWEADSLTFRDWEDKPVKIHGGCGGGYFDGAESWERYSEALTVSLFL